MAIPHFFHCVWAFLVCVVLGVAAAEPQLRKPGALAARLQNRTGKGEVLASAINEKALDALRSARMVTAGASHSLTRSLRSSLAKRRLQTASATATCSWDGGCHISPSFGAGALESLSSNSNIRTVWESSQACGVHLSQSACQNDMSSHTCVWDGSICDASFSGDDGLPFMSDILDTSDCGIFSAQIPAMRCEASPNCALEADCVVSSSGFSLNRASGTCSASCEHRDIWAAICGSGFSIESAMMGCWAEISTATQDTLPQVASDCIANACPSQDSFWREFMPAVYSCGAASTTGACSALSDCTWENGDCSPDFYPVMSRTLPDSCGYKGFLEAQTECNGLSSTACASSSNCAWQSELMCTSTSSPVSMSSCSVGGLKMAEVIAQSTCTDDSDAFAQIFAASELCGDATSETSCTAQAAPDATRFTCQRSSSSAHRGVSTSLFKLFAPLVVLLRAVLK